MFKYGIVNISWILFYYHKIIIKQILIKTLIWDRISLATICEIGMLLYFFFTTKANFIIFKVIIMIWLTVTFVGGLMSYLYYLCLFSHGGLQHILCCVFVLFFFVLCCQFLWIVLFDCSLNTYLLTYVVLQYMCIFLLWESVNKG
jgi:hypothetical protein